MINTSLGEKVKQLRKEIPLTQLEFAQILMIGHSTLACYETGKRQIPYDVLIRIAKFFEVTTDYLLGLED